jgi:hypothetical protein
MTVLVGSTSEGTTADNVTVGSADAWSFVAAQSGDAAVIKCQSKVANPGLTAIEMGIYTNNAGLPGTLLGKASVDSLAAAQSTGIFQATLSAPIPIVAGTTYHIGFWFTGEIFDWQGTTLSHAYTELDGQVALPATWTGGTQFNTKLAIWAEDASQPSYRTPFGGMPARSQPGRGPRGLTEQRYVTESDIVGGPWSIPLGQVTEIDLPQALSSSKTLAVGQTTETDVAQPSAERKSRIIAQTVETDLSQPLTRSKSEAIGQATETDLSQALTRSKRRALGQTTETELAQAITRKAPGVGQATEVDLSRTLQRVKSLSIGQTLESDLAQPLSVGSKYKDAVLADGPDHYWRLGESASPSIDLIGTLNASYGSGVTAGQQGLLRNDPDDSVLLSGAVASGVVTVPSLPSQLVTPFTVESLVKLGASPPAQHQVLWGIDRTTHSAVDSPGVIARRNATGNFLSWWDFSNTWLESGFSLTPGITYHVACVVESNKVTFYVNGAFISSVAAGVNPMPTTRRVQWIGGGQNATDQRLKGNIDEFALYGYALTADQIAHHYRVAVAAKEVAVGQVTETDLSQTLVVSKAHSVTLAQASETDLANGPLAVKLGINGAFETDLSQALAHLKRRALLQTSDTELAQALTHKKARAILQAAETDLAQLVQPGGAKHIGVAQAVEADIAQRIGRSRSLRQATETDVAQAIVRLKRRTLSQSVETDLSQALSPSKHRAILQSFETDLSRTLKRGVNVGRAVETDTARILVVSLNRRTGVTQVFEIDLAQLIASFTPFFGYPTTGHVSGITSGRSASVSDGSRRDPVGLDRGRASIPENGRNTRIQTGRPA